MSCQNDGCNDVDSFYEFGQNGTQIDSENEAPDDYTNGEPKEELSKSLPHSFDKEFEMKAASLQAIMSDREYCPAPKLRREFDSR